MQVHDILCSLYRLFFDYFIRTKSARKKEMMNFEVTNSRIAEKQCVHFLFSVILLLTLNLDHVR